MLKRTKLFNGFRTRGNNRNYNPTLRRMVSILTYHDVEKTSCLVTTPETLKDGTNHKIKRSKQFNIPRVNMFYLFDLSEGMTASNYPVTAEWTNLYPEHKLHPIMDYKIVISSFCEKIPQAKTKLQPLLESIADANLSPNFVTINKIPECIQNLLKYEKETETQNASKLADVIKRTMAKEKVGLYSKLWSIEIAILLLDLNILDVDKYLVESGILNSILQNFWSKSKAMSKSNVIHGATMRVLISIFQKNHILLRKTLLDTKGLNILKSIINHFQNDFLRPHLIILSNLIIYYSKFSQFVQSKITVPHWQDFCSTQLEPINQKNQIPMEFLPPKVERDDKNFGLEDDELKYYTELLKQKSATSNAPTIKSEKPVLAVTNNPTPLNCGYSQCGKFETETKFPRCSRCKTTVYCSPECQKQDWVNGHKLVCKSE